MDEPPAARLEKKIRSEKGLKKYNIKRIEERGKRVRMINRTKETETYARLTHKQTQKKIIEENGKKEVM